MNVKCNKCGKTMDISEACVCENCGAIECRSCAEKSFFLCDGCSGKFNFLN